MEIISKATLHLIFNNAQDHNMISSALNIKDCPLNYYTCGGSRGGGGGILSQIANLRYFQYIYQRICFLGEVIIAI